MPVRLDQLLAVPPRRRRSLVQAVDILIFFLKVAVGGGLSVARAWPGRRATCVTMETLGKFAASQAMASCPAFGSFRSFAGAKLRSQKVEYHLTGSLRKEARVPIDCQKRRETAIKRVNPWGGGQEVQGTDLDVLPPYGAVS